MSSCPICKVVGCKGQELQHTIDVCPIRNKFTCRRCFQPGHMTHMCAESWAHWERPACMEELIPLHIRNRYGITSATPIVYNENRGQETIYELNAMNEIQIPDKECDIKKLADLIKQAYQITFIKLKQYQHPGGRYKTEEYINAIVKWGKETGRRILPNKAMLEKVDEQIIEKEQKNTIIE